MIDEELLRNAARLAETEMAQADGKERRFYRILHRKLVRFHRRRDSFKITGMRLAAAAALTVLVVSGLMISLHPKVQGAMIGWLKENYEGIFRYSYSGTLEKAAELSCEPRWVPKGYVEKERTDGNGYRSIIYQNEKEQFLTFIASSVKAGAVYYHNPEQSKGELVFINGTEALLYTRTVKIPSGDTVYVSSSVSWISADGTVVFSILSNLSPEDLMRMARNVR